MHSVRAKKPIVSPAIIMSILLLTAVAAPLHLNKVSAIAPYLMETLKIGETQLSLLISVLPLTGIALALPGGMLIRKFGPWWCVLAALVLLLAGSVAGALTTSFALLVLSRVVEGAGMALVAIAGPSIVSVAANPKSRGLAMGLFACYMGIGQVITYNLAPRVLVLGGWQSVWWLASAYTILFLMIWLILMARLERKKSIEQNPVGMASASGSVMASKTLWLLSASIGLYVISYVSIQTFLPTYLAKNRGMALADAASLTSICCLAAIVSSLLAGFLSDRTGSRRVLGAASMVISAASFTLIPFIPTQWFLPYAVILGLIPPVLPVCAFAAASDAAGSPEQSGSAMGILILGQNIGLALGPLLLGGVAESLGWTTAFLITVPVALASGALMFANNKVR